LAVAVTTAGCGVGKPKPIAPKPGATQEGIAWWYGPGFHGRRTANGEVYNQYGLTAAHQTLPHGTRVRVTNLTNQRTVLVRINDRGPFVDDRIIDLSYTAAREIEMIGPGTAPVLVEVLDHEAAEFLQVAAAPPPRQAVSLPPPTPRIVALPPPTPRLVAVPAIATARELPPAARPQSPRQAEVAATVPDATRYAVQIGAFSDYDRARRTQRHLEEQGASAKLALVEEGGMRYYRLRLGPFAQQQDAVRTVERVNALGYPALIVADRAVWQ
jgi:rare lipoprotein A